MTGVTVGDFYEDEYGTIFEIVATTINSVTINRLRDNVAQTLDVSMVRSWISNGALTIYLSADEI
jgi:hypothetical protein